MRARRILLGMAALVALALAALLGYRSALQHRTALAETMSVDRMAQDGIELAELLTKHLGEKIVLLGHSYGSILGVHMVKRRPDLFHAYVGTGQVSDMRRSWQLSYAHVLATAHARGDRRAVKELEEIGPPPHDSMDKVVVQFRWLGNYAVESDQVATGRLILRAPDYSLRDIYHYVRGFAVVPTWRLYQEMLTADLPALGPDFQLPVFFFQGAEDETAQTAPAKEYFASIVAPHKELVPREDVLLSTCGGTRRAGRSARRFRRRSEVPGRPGPRRAASGGGSAAGTPSAGIALCAR
jgi:pimeloyl-ACP methyl ester carboxylesterase